MAEQKPERLKYVIDPLDRNYGIIFPEGTDENSKVMLALQLEKARRLGKDVELTNGVKIVPLKPLNEDEQKPQETENKTEGKTTETKPEEQKPVEQKPQEQTTQTEQKPEEKPVETTTEKVVTANPVNPENVETETQTVQDK